MSTDSPPILNWFVLYTKPRAEKKLAQQLMDDGIETYCPTKTEIKQWSDRKKKVETPVLPSMVLVHIEKNKRNMVFNRTHAVRYLFWQGKPAIVTQEEVDSLKSVTQDSTFKNHGLDRLHPGQKLDMTKLGFEKIEGTVTYVSANQCWVILENLGFVVKFKKNEL